MPASVQLEDNVNNPENLSQSAAQICNRNINYELQEYLVCNVV